MTYTDMLANLASFLGKTTPLSTSDKADLTTWLNASVDRAWNLKEHLIWECVHDSGTFTLTDYEMDMTSIDNATAFTVWAADPAEQFQERKAISVLALAAVKQGTKLKVQAASAAAAVVVYWRIPAPVYLTDDSVTDEVPDVLWRVIRALVRQEQLDWSPTVSQMSMQRALDVLQSETDDLVQQQRPGAYPWLDKLRWESDAQRNAQPYA